MDGETERQTHNGHTRFTHSFAFPSRFKLLMSDLCGIVRNGSTDRQQINSLMLWSATADRGL